METTDDLALVTVTCLHCAAKHEMIITAFHVRLYDHGLHARMEFFCLSCRVFNRKPVEEHAIHFLVKYGATHTIEHVPLEFLESKGGPVITEDEIDDFILDLEIAQKERRPLECA